MTNSSPPPFIIPSSLAKDAETLAFFTAMKNSLYELWYSLGGQNNGVIFEDRITLSAKTSDDLSEGATNLYFTNERVDDRVNGLLVAGNGVELNYNDASNSLTISTNGYYNFRVVVHEMTDFGEIINGRVKPSSDILYMLDGEIDTGGVSIEVQAGGFSLAGLSGGRDVMGLFCSEDNYTMFVSPSGGYSGDVVIESCTLTVTGLNSEIFNLDNDNNSNALNITGINFGSGTTSLGTLTDYRQLLFNNVGFIGIKDGLTFAGTWAGITVTTSIAVALPASTTLFKAGTGFTVGNVSSSINFLSVQPSSILFDFAPSNIVNSASFALDGVRSGADNAVPNTPSSSVKARFRNCLGIRNTYIGGKWTITSAAATTISSAGTFYKLAGTTTYSGLQHFSQTTDNAFVYDGDQEIDVLVDCNIGCSGTANNQVKIKIKQWKDSASAYVDISTTPEQTMNGGSLGTRAENISLSGIATLNKNDRIEIWITNITAPMDVTAIVDSQVFISERQS